MTQYASLIYVAVLICAFYLLIIRPQQTRQRQHAAMLASLEVGDRVVTAGGIHGTLIGVDVDTVRVEVSDGVVVDVEKAAIARKAGAI